MNWNMTSRICEMTRIWKKWVKQNKQIKTLKKQIKSKQWLRFQILKYKLTVFVIQWIFFSRAHFIIIIITIDKKNTLPLNFWTCWVMKRFPSRDLLILLAHWLFDKRNVFLLLYDLNDVTRGGKYKFKRTNWARELTRAKLTKEIKILSFCFFFFFF